MALNIKFIILEPPKERPRLKLQPRTTDKTESNEQSEGTNKGKVIVRKRRPKQHIGDGSKRGHLRRRKKKPKFGHKLGIAAEK